MASQAEAIQTERDMSLSLSLPEKEITLKVIHDTMEEMCRARSSRHGCSLRIAEKKDVGTILGYLNLDQAQTDPTVKDFDEFHAILLERGNVVRGAAVFYFAYSTWDGRILYLNKIQAESQEEETTLLRTLADTTVQLECPRLVWQHFPPKLAFYKGLGAENLEGWLTLRMGRDGMVDFLSGLGVTLPSVEDDLSSVIGAALEATRGMLEQNNLRLCHATTEHVQEIERLVFGLALYEKEPESMHIGKEHYELDGFGRADPWFQCLLLQDVSTGRFCGMALFYFGYDFGKGGKFLYLEDLFIEESCRGRSGGKSIMVTLATIAQLLHCTGFQWQALDWNTPALTFYRKIGAKILDGQLTTRFVNKDLVEFSKGPTE